MSQLNTIYSCPGIFDDQRDAFLIGFEEKGEDHFYAFEPQELASFLDTLIAQVQECGPEFRVAVYTALAKNVQALDDVPKG